MCQAQFRSMQDILANLNPEQLKAVTLPRQCALILAGCIPQEVRNDPVETYDRPPNGSM